MGGRFVVSIQVTAGAALLCSFGVAPSTLTVVPTGPPVLAGGALAATVQDNKPLANIAPFGMCTTITNPQVAAATSAALGVLTPQPCIPVTTAPWSPGSTSVLIGGQPALVSTCTLLCQWGGTITITAPGSATTVMTG